MNPHLPVCYDNGLTQEEWIRTQTGSLPRVLLACFSFLIAAAAASAAHDDRLLIIAASGLIWAMTELLLPDLRRVVYERRARRRLYRAVYTWRGIDHVLPIDYDLPRVQDLMRRRRAQRDGKDWNFTLADSTKAQGRRLKA